MQHRTKLQGRGLRRAIAAVLTLVLTASLLIQTSEPALAHHPLTVPSDFVATRVASSLSGPTALAQAPDGRFFMSSQNGQVRIIENDTLLPDAWGTVPVELGATQGLFGLTFDPDFENNGHLYVFHTLRVGTNLRARVSRYTTVGNSRASGATTIWESPNLRENTAVSHYGGDLLIGPDDKLYISFGDDLAVSRPQSLNSVFGKILRVNLDGSIPTDNPFYAQTSGKNKAIYALGVRNPFKMAVDSVSGRIFQGDVGRDSWEEINDIVAGGNYGWPTYEGPSNAPGFIDPLLAYPHDNPGGVEGCASSAGAFYTPEVSQYPSQFAGQFFASDFCKGWVKVVDPATGAISDFATIDSPLDTVVSHDGSVYVLSRDSNDDGQTSGGSLWKFEYSAPGSPVITTQPASQTATAGIPVTFAASATGDAPLAYQWQRDGVDIPGATDATYTFTPTLADDEASFRVFVSNPVSSVLSNTAELQVNEGGGIPSISFTAPLETQTWGGGDLINFAATVTDPEDGTLPPSALTWTINLHHDEHFHPVVPATSGIASGTFTVPVAGETSPNVWFRIILEVEDSSGNEVSSFVDVFPRKSTLTLETTPPGLTVTVDGETFTTPASILGVEGIEREISAFAAQELGGTNYEWQSWSSGESRDHVLSFPAVDTTLMADFDEVIGGGGTAPTISGEPSDVTAFAGDSASFSVVANGDAPLTYQWQREGIDIPGATSPTYTTAPTTSGDDFAGYRVLVTNDVGTVASRTAILRIEAGSPRVTDGLTGLWQFTEGSGSTVMDSSGFGVPLDLTIADPQNISWMAGGGITINTGTEISSGVAATKIIDASVATNEITLEAWASPASENPAVAGRIAGLTDGSSGTKRNVGISQGWWTSNPKTRFDARVRTSASYNNAFNTPAGSAATELTHVVLTRAADGVATIYLDGVVSGSRATSGDFVWHNDVPFVIGNELSGIYPFLGDIHLVATYDRALTALEVVENFDAGIAAPPAVQAPAIVSSPSDVTVTEGETAQFSVVATGTNPLTYQWQLDGADISGATSPTYTTAATTLGDSGGVYSVSVSNSAGTAASAGATLTVDEALTAPVIVTSPTDTTVTEGQTADFTVEATGSDPLTYQWKLNGVDLPAATSATYTTPATALVNDGDVYAVTVSNGAGSVESADATLTVEVAASAPEIVDSPLDASVTEGDPVTFSVVATGAAPLTYQWERDGVPISGATSADYTIAATALADDQAAFTVVVANGIGSVESAPATLTVSAAVVAPTIVDQPSSATVAAGAAASFTVNVNGDEPLTFDWRRNGTSIGAASTATLTIDPTSLADNGDVFDVVVSNSAGTVTSDAATLTVLDGARVTAGLTGLWTFGEGVGDDVADSSGFGSPLDLTIADPANVTWLAGGGITITSSTHIASDVYATKIMDASLASGEITYEAWVTPANATPSSAGRIAALADGSTGTKRNGGISQGWWNSNNKTRFDTRLRTAGSYNNSMASASGTVTTELTHVVLTGEVGDRTRLYLDGQLIKTRSLTGDFTWHDDVPFVVGNELSGNYPFIGTIHLVAMYDAALSAAEVQQNFEAGVTATPPPTNSAPTVEAGADDLIAVGEAVSLSGSITDDGLPTPSTITSLWTASGPGTATFSDAIAAATTAQFDTPGSYVVTLTADDGELTGSDTLTIEVQTPPSIVTEPQSVSVATGDLATFNVAAAGSETLTYQWYRDGVPIAEADYTALEIFTTLADDGAVFTVEVTNDVGSVTSAAATLTVTESGITVEGDPTVTVVPGVGQFAVSWEPVDGATLYQLRYRPVGSARVWFPPANTFENVITGVVSGLDHQIEVRAYTGSWGPFTRVVAAAD